MKYLVRDCDPNTGEPDDDGYDDEYVVCHTCGMKAERFNSQPDVCSTDWLPLTS